MLHNDSLIYHRRCMILATLRNSLNSLNKIIVYRRGLSPVCVHVALLYTTCCLHPAHALCLSHKHRLQCGIISARPVYLYCDLKRRLVPRIVPWLLPFLNSPFSFPPFIGSFSLILQLNVCMFITPKVSSSPDILLHPYLKPYSSHFGIFALLGSYAAYYDSLLPLFRDNLWFPSPRVKQICFLDCLILKDGADRLSLNVGNKLPICAQ
jgi:hypothetical protein